MKRLADFEGREESAGPLFECAPRNSGRQCNSASATVPGPVSGTSAPLSPPDTITHREVAELRRDLGIACAAHAAERASPGWEVEACAQVMEYAKRHAHFAVEDVRAVYGTPEGIDAKAWGPAMKRAARLGIVKADGFVLVNCSNRSPRTNWKSLVYEGSPQP